MAAITPVLKAAKWCSFIPTNQSYIMYHETAWMHPSRQSLLHCRNNTLFQSFPIRLSKRKKQWRKDSTNRTCIWRWFQWKPTHQSTLVYLFLIKAYNTVWRKKLPLHVLNIGASMVCWLHSFMNDRQAWVQLFNVLSNSRRFKPGLTELDRFSSGVSHESYNWTLGRGRCVPSLLGQMTANGFQI